MGLNGAEAARAFERSAWALRTFCLARSCLAWSRRRLAWSFNDLILACSGEGGFLITSVISILYLHQPPLPLLAQGADAADGAVGQSAEALADRRQPKHPRGGAGFDGFANGRARHTAGAARRALAGHL